MRVLTPHFVAGKVVLVRIDMDVPIGLVEDENGHPRRTVLEDLRLEAALPILYLCMQYADKVVVMGHIGRPEGKEVPHLSVEPIVEWLDAHFPSFEYPADKLQVLENLRFEAGEDACNLNYAKELASLGEVYINEAFASHHPASSTTVVPTLIPSALGFHFHHELEILSDLRDHPGEDLVSVIGGAKIEDKLGVVEALAGISSKVLLGGKLPAEIKEKGISLPDNVLVGVMDDHGLDLSDHSVTEFIKILSDAKTVIWSGPMGKYEDGFVKGTTALGKEIIKSGAYSVIGGGDTITALNKVGLLEQFSFVSTGGGAMLEYLAKGTLPTIEVLK